MDWTAKHAERLRALDARIGRGKATRQQVLDAIALKNRRAAAADAGEDRLRVTLGFPKERP